MANDLGNQYALHALRERRAELSGEIASLKRRIANLKETILHLDGALRAFDPNTNPADIPDKRFVQNVKPFGGGKMNRLIFTVLRKAGKPLSTQEVVEGVAAELGYGADAVKGMKHHVRSNLNYLVKSRGLLAKEGERRAVKWSLSQCCGPEMT